MVIAGTGHRPNKLGGYGPEIRGRLIQLAKAIIHQHRPSLIISGMALGWDMALAQAAISEGIPLIAAVPFRGQESQWPRESQEYYQNILIKARSVVYTSEGVYSPAKMQIRNEWMVNQAEVVWALWDGKIGGGTWNCIQYAHRVGKPVLNYWGSWAKYR
ncbi:MAG TPA: SLOG family protein [Bellilinea sp.]|nr:SLOG family protein [Bellilinea sp.]